MDERRSPVSSTISWLAGPVCAACTLGAALTLFAPPAMAQQPNRAQYSFKGDLFVWPLVRLRWDVTMSGDLLTQDTIITVTNDDIVTRTIKFFYVDGVSWSRRDTAIILTGNQSRYFSAFSGAPGTVAFRSLVPNGYPDGAGATTRRKLDGFIVGWTVDGNGLPIGTNQQTGGATLVDYGILDQTQPNEAVWAYRAWSFRSLFVGQKPGDPGVLKLDGNEYQPAPCDLLLDFWTPNVGPPGQFCPHVDPPNNPCQQDFELTLVNMTMDFRATPDHDFDGTSGENPDDLFPATNPVGIDTWGCTGVGVSNQNRCIACWDSGLASTYVTVGGGGSPFLIATTKGSARIHCVEPSACTRPPGSQFSQIPLGPRPAIQLPLVGIAHKIITWPNPGADPKRLERAASALTVLLERTDGFIKYDFSGQATEEPTLQGPMHQSLSDSGNAAPAGNTRR